MLYSSAADAGGVSESLAAGTAGAAAVTAGAQESFLLLVLKGQREGIQRKRLHSIAAALESDSSFAVVVI